MIISAQISSNVVAFIEITLVLFVKVHKLFFNVACTTFSDIEHTSHKPWVIIKSGFISNILSLLI